MSPHRALCRIVSIALLLLASGASAEGLSTVQVVGLSAFEGSSLQARREAAIQDALRAAVQQVVGVLLSTSTLVENYELVEDRIYSRAAGIAVLSRILEEGPTVEGLYRVVAEVGVREADLTQELYAVIRANGDPRVLVAASGGPPGTSSLAASVLEGQLLELGFSVIVGSTDGLKGTVEIGALSVGADLVALVDISIHENLDVPAVLRDTHLVSVTVVLTARLLEPSSGRIITVEQSRITRVGSGYDLASQEAVQSASSALGEELAKSAANWLQGSSAAERVSTVVLEGHFGFSDVQYLITELELRHGATATLRSLDSGNAVLEVALSGRVQGLLATLSDLGWEIRKVEGMHVTAWRDLPSSDSQ